MILTTCAVCAKSLDLDAPARCVGCQTRYCSDRCLRYHAHRGGHDDECEEIERAGGAEQFNAEKKYAEAAAEAIEACAEETAGQTCYICLEDGSEEGLVRRCACRGSSGFAHLSCLVRQAEIKAQGNLSRGGNLPFGPWDTCRLCEQEFHGPVLCALGWACWKTYAGRPDEFLKGLAMTYLGHGLNDGTVRRYEEALQVYEANLEWATRRQSPWDMQLTLKGSIASLLMDLNRVEESIARKRANFAERQRVLGPEDERTLVDATGLCALLIKAEDFVGCKQFMRENSLLEKFGRTFGPDHVDHLCFRRIQARALYLDDGAPLDDLRQAVEILEDVSLISSRLVGPGHPATLRSEKFLGQAREKLARANDDAPPSPPPPSAAPAPPPALYDEDELD
jgi:hypothetical protein